MKSTAEVDLVRPSEEMNDDTFIKHMNHRHDDSLGGLKQLTYVGKLVVVCWRAYHEQLHALRIDLEHEHAKR